MTGAALVRNAGRAAGLLFLFVGAIALFLNLVDPFKTDFLSFWAASVLTLEGNPAHAYDVAIHHEVQQRALAFDALLPFAYPPPFLLLLLPFGALPYGLAFAFWTTLGFTGFALAIRYLSRGALWQAAAFPPVLPNLITGQAGLLTGALFAGGLMLLQVRPGYAGLLLGLLVVKPHLALLIPLALLAGGHWRSLIAAAASAFGSLLLALLLFGHAPYAGLLDIAPLFASIAADGLTGWHKMATPFATLRVVGLPQELAWIAHATIAGCAAILVAWAWRSSGSLAGKASLLASATMLVSPYLYAYDATILILPMLWLAREGERLPVLAGAWLLLLIGIAQNWVLTGLPNATGLASVLLLLLTARRLLGEVRAANGLRVVSAT